ncbi:phage tail tape measure protein [[Clostridium] scindens]|uniref:phage tail tape measure protein n=1 Tax=Clostridium scindens (strain JCM 10418 / VPI 12708) TaxID=29347 RepID=UPI001D084915|nr:phage tail tape measure protein [[Clostridium] scindens]MCB6286912.1 phage tail tape measure protein [[Clostridium] scindens]MCB7193382.1 phage tail tape measure protein [[Clostridium] scindens]MCB7286509.1 phage tail tape measure protein [[Clostridium] scindens]MCQ5288358.1 phage tail tape measure protein [[Clostridium] scindens]
MADGNNLFVLGLNVSASKALIESQLISIVNDISKSQVAKVTLSIDNSKTKQELQNQVDAISKSIKVGDIGKQSNSSALGVSNVTKQFKGMQSQIQSTQKTSGGFFSNLKSGMSDALGNMLKYQLAYKIINTTINSIKSMVNEVTELDASLTEFNKVADLSANELSQFTEKAYVASAEIGRTGKDMIDAATEFKRAGYDLDKSLEMGNAALVMTNVADGIDKTEDSASTLISVLKGFNESDVMSIVDKMNSVSNQSPVGFDNIADGLERVSGTMNQAGNSIDETIGLLTGGFAQLRNMEKVSTGLITISQRLRGVDEDGSSIDGLGAKLQESFGSIGVNIEDANGELRSTYDILSDYANVYDTLDSKQKQYFAELASGKRQVNVFNAIVQQMDDVKKAVDQSVDSVGAAEKENEIFKNSIEGRKNEFNSAFQKLSTTVVESDWIKDLLSAGTEFLNMLDNIASKETVVSSTIEVITNAVKGLADILSGLSENDVFASLISGYMSYKTLTKGFDLFSLVTGNGEIDSGKIIKDRIKEGFGKNKYFPIKRVA